MPRYCAAPHRFFHHLDMCFNQSPIWLLREFSSGAGTQLIAFDEAPLKLPSKLECLGFLGGCSIQSQGERRYEKLHPEQTISLDAIAAREPMNGKEAEFIIEEDDEYHIEVLNMNARNIILTMNVDVSAEVYNTNKAKKMCSTANRSCMLSLLFPNMHCVILTPPNIADPGGWVVEVSFVARVVTYIALLGFITLAIFLILKYLGACDGDLQSTSATVDTYRTSNVVAAREVTETEPMVRVEPNRMTYGTNQEDGEESEASSSSSEELYDEKLCVICYDEQCNCFFVPCGHCATCYDCAQRIVDEESKVCPICRRLIHKARRLFNS